MRRTSIRFRLIKRLALALAVVAVSTNAGLFLYLRGELIEQYDDALRTQAEAVAAVWQSSDRGHAAEAIDRAFPKLRFGSREGHYAWLVRSDRVVVLRVPEVSGKDVSTPWVSMPPGTRQVYGLILPNGRPGRAVRVDVDPSADVARVDAPRMTLIFAESRREMDSTLSSLAVWLFAVGGGLSVACIGLVLVIVRRELRPLGSFSDAVGRLNVDSLDYRFDTSDVAEELLPVSTRLNDLLQRLEAAFSRERRFTGNVSHELRTPLAELRSMVEVAMKWPPGPAETRRHHEQVLDVVARMSTITQTLLSLVRTDATSLGVSLTEVDLIPLLRAAAAPHEGVAAERDVALDWGVPDTCRVRTDPAVLSSLLDNLFANAALYAVPASRIVCDVCVSADGDTATVGLTNAVSDLTADDLARLDEPFWRKDPARSPGDHAGLGLTLVRAYAKALGVDVTFRMTASGRMRVDVVLSRRPDAVPPAHRAII